MAVSDAKPGKNELVDDRVRGITVNPQNDYNTHKDHNDDDHDDDDDSRSDSKYIVNGKKVYTGSRHNSSVVDIRSGGKRNDHVEEHHQEDNTYNSSRRSDGGRVDSTGAFIASRGDKTVSEVDGGDRKELPTTIHPSSYGNHDPLMSGGHDDNNTHHVRDPLDTSKLLSLAEQLLSNITKCITIPSSSSSSSPFTSSPMTIVAMKTTSSPNITDLHTSTRATSSSSSTTTTTSTSNKPLELSKLPTEQMEKLLNNPMSTLPKHSMKDTDSQMAQIEWLLRGLPEAYDSEPYYDDEAVEAILKEGGSPPNQLQLPSVYAINQHILSKLTSVNILRIRFTNLLVFSTRYGIRKEGTYLLVHPPIGSITPSNESNAMMLPLSELEDSSYTVSQVLRRNSKKDSIRNYFVGGLELVNKNVDFNLSINDKVMKEWIKGSARGSVLVQLFSYLAPRDSMVRGKLLEPVCIGTVKIPLGGLLGTPSLDAIMNCDVEVDISNHSAIVSRMNNISFGQVITKPKPLGPKLGTLLTRISLLSTMEHQLQYNSSSGSGIIERKSNSRGSSDNNSNSSTENTVLVQSDTASQSALLKSLLNINPASQEVSTLLIPVISEEEVKSLQLVGQKDCDNDFDNNNFDDGNNNNDDKDNSNHDNYEEKDIAKYMQQKRLDYINNHDSSPFKHISNDKLHNALSFTLTEAPKSNSDIIVNKINNGNDKAIYGNSHHNGILNSFFSITFCAFLNLHIPANCMIQLQNQDESDGQRCSDIFISFKLNAK
jgi:hypothetical protein